MRYIKSKVGYHVVECLKVGIIHFENGDKGNDAVENFNNDCRHQKNGLFICGSQHNEHRWDDERSIDNNLKNKFNQPQ